MKEPQKYVVGANGGLQLSNEWKEWRKRKLGANTIQKTTKKRKYVGRLEPIDPDNHRENWKEIAWVSGSEKRILFCCCRSQTGQPYSGCGAVGIRYTRAGKITVVVESRFE